MMPPHMLASLDNGYGTDCTNMSDTYELPDLGANDSYDSFTDFDGFGIASDMVTSDRDEVTTSEDLDISPSPISPKNILTPVNGFTSSHISNGKTSKFMKTHSTMSATSTRATRNPYSRHRSGLKRKVLASKTSLDPPTPQMTDAGAEEILNLSIRSSRTDSLPIEIHGIHAIYPKSHYQGWTPPLDISTESQVIKEFTEQLRSNATFDNKEFTEYLLQDFSVYLPRSNCLHAYELVSLNNLATKPANSTYTFNGILNNGTTQRYVEGIQFQLCSIGGYGEDVHEVGDQIWLQSKQNEKQDIWYRLGQPAAEYNRFHVNFIWLANLSKYVIDFAHHEADEGRTISIFSFREEFFAYLDATHTKNAAFHSWYKQYNDTDFRRAVAANSEFLYKEASGVDTALEKHIVWREILAQQSAIPEQELCETKTVVTPFVYECFKGRVFSECLKAVEPVKDVALRRQSLGDALKLTEASGDWSPNSESVSVKMARKLSFKHHSTDSSSINLDVASITEGDILGISTDPKHLSRWEVQDDLWFVFVLRVDINQHGKRSFNVLWLYKPSDTICDKMYYPYDNELFLSDHCNCGDSKILEDDILCKVSVDFDVSPRQSDFFIRQTYQSDEHRFVTYQKEHLLCRHQQELTNGSSEKSGDEYNVGDTVLILKHSAEDNEDGHLEPREIVEFVYDERQPKVRLRELAFRSRYFPEDGIAPNELIYTNRFHTQSIKRIIRKCIIRFYTQAEVCYGLVRTPYDRNGTGDAFYITTRLVDIEGKQELQPIESNIPRSMEQGFDPRAEAPRKKLRGMDLYCGGGNFGRGLEEGGAVKMEWAVDIDSNALHTYHANMKDSTDCKLYLGSVDDFLTQALAGNPYKSDKIPMPGEVDFICAGCPCQGFSLLNSSRGNDKGLKNQSLIADVATYVDFYRPKYALLENVTTMASSGKWRHESALSQLLCTFVAMNYQVQLFTLDAWSFGSPQARTRLFVSLAAPGLQLPPHPSLSHSHPPDTKDRGLGKAANGQRFGMRRKCATTFEYVTAGEATADLPWIGDSRPMTCIKYPDHRIIVGVTEDLKAQIESIPTYPRGMNFVKTWQAGRRGGKIVAPDKVLMSDAERRIFPSDVSKNGGQRESVKGNSRAYGRVNPDGLFTTVTTFHSIQCARGGTCLHWDQQRPLTVMEARRAQSYPDNEVLTGNPRKQWKIIGNSVSRAVSLALGLSLREAWLRNPPDEEMPTMAAVAPTFKAPTSASLFRNVAINVRETASDESASEEVEAPLRHSLKAVTLSSTSHSRNSDSSASSPPSSKSVSTSPVRPSKRPQPISPALPPKKRLCFRSGDRPAWLLNSSDKRTSVEIIDLEAPVQKTVQKTVEKRLKSFPTSVRKDKQTGERIESSGRNMMESDDEERNNGRRVVIEETRTRKVYVPVDNSAFVAYERTAKDLGR